jgi:hypothetical protein
MSALPKLMTLQPDLRENSSIIFPLFDSSHLYIMISAVFQMQMDFESPKEILTVNFEFLVNLTVKISIGLRSLHRCEYANMLSMVKKTCF